ncbi:MAG: peptidoglycan D,D-transpeptidase FtsI family protein [Patescibacteria group bacterium]
MWRDKAKIIYSGRVKDNNNRLRLVVAIVFLLAGSLIYKLFNVQITQCDWYTALASSQHQVYSKLKPNRGQIYLKEKINNQEKFYPIATNKDFAFLYAIPKNITDPALMAEKAYEYFDKPLQRNTEVVSTSTGSSTETSLVNISKEEKIIDYLKRLDKPGDPYEPLKNKISSDELLGFYASIITTTSTPVTAKDLEIKNEKVVYKNASSTLAAELKIPGFGFDFKNYRYYPENEIGSQLLGYVSYIDEEEKGHYGLEEFFNDDLYGKFGSVKTERGAKTDMMIVNNREYVKPENGSDLVLTVDRNIEFFACEKLKETVKKHGASGGSVIIISPKTGAIIAMCSEPSFNPNDYNNVKDISVFNNPSIFYQYEPGSVFKVVTMAIAIDQGKVSPSTTYNDAGEIMIPGWNKPIKNSDFSSFGGHGVVNMNTVLDYSLNTGAIFAMRQVGPKVFADYVKNFGFGERTGIELGSESPGNIGNLFQNKVKEIDAATASFGQGIAVTPLQMIMPYQAIANNGVLMKPYIVDAIIRPDGKTEVTVPKQVHRVVSEKTAATISAMLVNVVENGHAKKAHLDGYYLGGKTGTAQVATSGGYSTSDYIHTFIGIGPIDNPAFVMLTKIDRPKDVQYAEGSALPLWKDIADFMLKYYQIPKTRK